ncbi:MAG TPA: hypothetical protein VJ063_11505 [Verrucomicrobiae bacterium]|nr:hypothetical protein [Verrucomicrobiae bacterium]
MKIKRTSIILLSSFVLVDATIAAQAGKPKGWFVAGSHAREYVASVDRETPHRGKGSAHFESAVLKTGGFGTLMQIFQAGDFRGKRVRLSGYVRSRNVQDWAGLWMRVDGSGGKALAFDNMQGRPIKGTTDWTKYDIVLEVPAQAEQIAYGVLLTGRGDVWMDDLKFDVVADGTATTADSKPGQVPAVPINLDFEN